jgi:hypothetical protein
MYQISFPPTSNRASWAFTGQITDLEDNLLDLSALSLRFEVRDQDGCLKLDASTGNGKLTIVGTGLFQWNFTREEMGGLCAGTYQTGMTMANDTDTMQLSVGPLPIVEGVVR